MTYYHNLTDPNHSQSPHNEKRKNIKVIYCFRTRVFPSEYKELPGQSPQLGNTGIYTPSKASPIWDFYLLGNILGVYIPYCPVEDYVMTALRTQPNPTKRTHLI